MLALFTVTTFLGAGLVFLVQPMVAKMMLPLLGGSPSVWNTAMVFFQALLLAGYGYAHLSTKALGVRRQAVWHVGVLVAPLAVLPIGLPASWIPPMDGSPALWLLGALALAVGLPYLVVTTASPLLQRWFSITGHRQAGDPYFLYAAGNAGSLLALLGYPFLLEPRLDLQAQANVWTVGYVAFVALCIACVVVVRRRGSTSAESPAVAPTGPAIPLRTKLRWVAFAFVPSSLMLGATQFISTDVAAIPLLWVIPLSLYLISFILAFARLSGALVTASRWILPVLAVVLAATFLEVLSPPLWVAVLLHLLTLMVVALLAHGRLALERPEPARLTEFYLLLALGGVLGGAFNALLAPVLFRSVLEYPLVIVLSLLLIPRVGELRLLPLRFRWIERVALAALLYHVVVNLLWTYQGYDGLAGTAGLAGVALLAGGVATVLASRPPVFAACVAAIMAGALTSPTPVLRSERTFFGVYEVYESWNDRHVLLHGTTIHGYQSLDPDLRTVPLSYHHPDGPLGELFAFARTQGLTERVAIVGLGVGTMAAYGRPGEHYDFYEIDPAVVDMATDPDLFTYLADSEAEIDVVLGDGRLTLADDSRPPYGLIMLNAFTSDAIPVHLLTAEAMAGYVERLAPGGMLLFNVTNRYLDVESVVVGVADHLGLATLGRYDPVNDQEAGRSVSHWIVVAREPDDFGALAGVEGWYRPEIQGGPVWTDSFSNVLQVYNWRY